MTSGVRLGTPAVTTRGLKEDDMDMIAECIALVLQSEDNIEKVKGMVAELTANILWICKERRKKIRQNRKSVWEKDLSYPGGFYCCLNKMSNSEKIEQNI